MDYVDAAPTGEVKKIWVQFEKGAGAKWQNSRQTNAVGIERTSAAFQDKDGKKAERRQFPLVLAKAVTIHKSQAATYHQGVRARLDATVTQPGQAYVALSRSTTKALCTLDRFEEKSLRFNADADRSLTLLKLKQAQSKGPTKPALQQLWRNVIKPAEGEDFYKDKLEGTQPPNWEQWDEAKRTKAVEKIAANRGSFTCPRCGSAFSEAQELKTHRPKCPSKPKAKPAAKPKAKAKAKESSRPKTKQPEQAGISSNAARRPAFFERQAAAQCRMHALNSAPQRATLAPEDMRAAALDYLQAQKGVDDDADEHIRAGG